MKRLEFLNFSDAFSATLCFICAISLQVQITLFSAPGYLGLRINLTDLLVPLAGITILITILTRRSLWPEWHMKHVYAWLAAITLILATAIFNAFINYGEINRWALTNKFGGWIILMAIMGMGAWIGTNARREHIHLFIKVFLYFSLTVLVYLLLVIVLRSYETTAQFLEPDRYAFFPIYGFMVNRNAYGFLILTAIIISTCIFFSKEKIVPDIFVRIFYFLLPMFMIFNGSRAIFLALCMIVPALLLLNWKHGKKCLQLLLLIALGFVVVFGIYHDKKGKLLVLRLKQTEVLSKAMATGSIPSFISDDEIDRMNPEQSLSELGEGVKYPGDSMRLTILEDALEMLQQSPIVGSGLGSVMLYQQQKHGRMINLIDSTPLWIAVEMGAIGLMIFTLFYWQVVKSFWLQRKTDDDFQKTYYTAMLFIIFGFTFTCLFHEIMYTRHMWFLIGLGLALKTRQTV